MHSHLWLLAILVTICSSQQDPCPRAQWYQFFTKQCTNPQVLIKNPYKHPSTQYLERVKENLQNKQRVCAIKYLDPKKQTYQYKNFPTRSLAENQGWIVTHQGICGKCSTTKDLFVYLTTDLTRKVRKCGMLNFYSVSKLRECLDDIGFSDPCREVWLWNTINTRKHCGLRCFWSFLIGQPFVKHDHLNKCIQCDENISGPIFKYESGRTRRNSGIKSQIDRPIDQIYNVTHCYY